jgi:hypothetical protein
VRVWVTLGKPLDKFMQKLIQGRPHGLGAFTSAPDKLLVCGESDSHREPIDLLGYDCRGNSLRFGE